MMKKLLFLLVAAISATFCTSAITVGNNALTGEVVTGVGIEKTEIRKVNTFSEVSTNTSIDVHYSQGPKCTVRVSADSNIIDYVVTEVSGSRLVVKYKNNTSIRTNKVKTVVYVTSPEINLLKASSSGDIYVDSSIKSNNIKLSSSSSGDIKAGNIVCKSAEIGCSSSGDVVAKVRCQELEASTSSSGDITLGAIVDRCKLSSGSSGDMKIKGSCSELCTVSCSSSGDADLSEFVCAEVEARSSSGGTIRCHATQRLEASASSGGDILYTGNPKEKKLIRSSGGQIKEM